MFGNFVILPIFIGFSKLKSILFSNDFFRTIFSFFFCFFFNICSLVATASSETQRNRQLNESSSNRNNSRTVNDEDQIERDQPEPPGPSRLEPSEMIWESELTELELELIWVSPSSKHLVPGFALVRPAERNDPLSSITFRTSTTKRIRLGFTSTSDRKSRGTDGEIFKLKLASTSRSKVMERHSNSRKRPVDESWNLWFKLQRDNRSHSTSQQFTHKQRSTESPFSIGKLRPSSGPNERLYPPTILEFGLICFKSNGK